MERDDKLWLTGLEYDVLICAVESWGILPYLVEHRHPDGEWTSPDGQRGAQYGDPIDHAELPSIFADPDTWDELTDGEWIGELTLSLTPEWSSFLAGRHYAPLPTWTTH